MTLTLDVDPGAALTVWYKDLDNDGYSDGVTQTACVQPTGHKAAGDLAGPEIDCDDNIHSSLVRFGIQMQMVMDMAQPFH
ncbi:MAG: hypothetical protein R2788_01385 [Saprospiraceae bacterium]